MMKCASFAVVAVVLFCSTQGSKLPECLRSFTSRPSPKSPCQEKSGICLLKEKCRGSRMIIHRDDTGALKNLCPDDGSFGPEDEVACCATQGVPGVGLDDTPASCKSTGGVCRDWCGIRVRSIAGDCPSSCSMCCALTI